MTVPAQTRSQSRRDFLRLTGLAGLGALTAPSLLAACAAPGQAAATPAPSPSARRQVRIGYLPITDAAPLLLAHARGIYAEEGLDVEKPTLFRGWSQIAEAFQADQVDIVHLLMPMTVWLRFANSVPLKVVAWDHTGGSAITVAPDVETIGDLAGKTIAVPFWYSIHNVVLQLLLRDAGLKPVTTGDASADDGTVKLVVMAPPDMPPALSTGSIAGFVVADPFNAVAEVNKIGRVLRFTGDVWLNHACCVVTASEAFIAKSPDVVQAVVSSVARAQVWAAAERTEAARILSTEGEGYLPQPRPAIARALSHYDRGEYGKTGAVIHPDWPTERIGFQPFPFPTYTQELVRLLKDTTVEGDTKFLSSLDAATVHGSLVDDRFARTAIAALGGPAAFGLPADLARTELIVP
ncbi:MAG: ABC transporter substrate-binding protein [Chloroflexi bacterium]|nr:ABC transporter substrate-binding protein [Chloroflexota bacterium]